MQQAGYDADSNASVGLEPQDSFNGKDALDDSYNVLVSPVSPLPDDESEDECVFCELRAAGISVALPSLPPATCLCGVACPT